MARFLNSDAWCPPLNYEGDFLALKNFLRGFGVFFGFKGRRVHMGGLAKIICEGGIQL